MQPKRNLRKLLLVNTLIFITSVVWAQGKSATIVKTDTTMVHSHIEKSYSPQKTAFVRPKVGLVLSGGGAKGMAHIGVLKKMEEIGLYPDYITGTSMGSIVGGLYSIGYSIDELEDVARNSKWLELMTNNQDAKLVSIKQKDDFGWWPIEISFDNRRRVMSSGVIEAPNLSLFFSRLTWCTSGINKFSDFPIPFRCYGVDILKGKLVEFKEGDLARAIRGSMAIPMVFSPVLIENPNDTLLVVDGGVMHNFPVDEVRDMGADIVIGSYTGYEDEVSANEMNSIAKITGRVLMFGGVNDSRLQMEKVDPRYRIQPNLKGIQPSDFLKADKIIRRGEEAAIDRLADLKKLADSLNAIEPRQRPKPLPRHDTIIVNHVIINGLSLTNGENAYGIIDIHEDQIVTPQIIEDAINRLYATLLYNSISYSIQTSDDNKISLIFNVKEKGTMQLKFGGYYDNIYNIGFTFKYSHRNFLWKLYDAYVYVNINKYPGIQAQLSRNLGKNDVLAVYTRIRWDNDFKTLYNGSKRLGNVGFMHSSWDILGGSRTLGNYTKVELSPILEYFKFDTDENDNIDSQYALNSDYIHVGARFMIKHNTLDNNIFPKNGSRWNIEAKAVNSNESVYYKDNGIEIDSHHKYLKFSSTYEQAFTFSNNTTTLIPWASIGLSTKDIVEPDKFYIGGFEYYLRYGQTPYIGLQPNQLCANNYSIAGLTFRQEIFKYGGIIFRTNMVVTYDHLEDIQNPTVKSIGGGIGIIFRTPIGPICYMRSLDTYAGYAYRYFNIGFNLPYIK